MAGKPGERLTKFANVWEELKASPEVTKIVRFGHKIIFESKPPVSLPSSKVETKLPSETMKIIKREICDLVSKGAMQTISPLEAKQTLGFYSKMFVVPKPESGKFRVIINLKPLNKYVKKETFKMEGLNDVKNILSRGCFGAIVDLSDAYYHVKLHQKSRKYTRFIFQGQIFEYCALPMGLTDSPRIFTRVTKFVQGFLRRQGIEVVMYIDDILVVGSNFEECQEKVVIVLGLLRRLGFLLNDKKCNLIPSQKFIYLGFVWDTVLWTVTLKSEREVKVREAARKLLSSDIVKCREVAAFLGRVQSTATAVPLARALVRTLQWEFVAACLIEADYDRYMYISQDSKLELQYWKDLPEGLNMPITLSQSALTVTTDATLDNYGIYYDGILFSEEIPEEFADFSINVKELLPLDIWLNTCGRAVSNCVVTWRVDNNSALQAIKNQGSRKSWPLSILSVNILKKANSRNIIIDPVRVTSEENILADAASRKKQVQDWSLSEVLAQKMFARWGMPDVDLMATVMSRKAPMYYSWSRNDPEAWGQDSLARDMDWTKFSLPYCFPPFPLLGQVLSKIREQKVEKLLLVVPWWPTKVWFSTLLSMLLDCRRFRYFP